MNTEYKKPDDADPEQAGTTKQLTTSKNRTGSTRSWLLLLAVSVPALVLAVFNYRSIDLLKTDTSITDTLTRYSDQLDAMKDSVGAVTSRQQDMEIDISRFAEADTRNAAALQAIHEDLGRDNTGWAVAEIEHLLTMAIHSLTLQRDLNTALAALQAADTRLANLDDPGLLDTRRQLAADMNALKAVNVVDVTGLALYLADLLDRVDELPLREVPLIENIPASGPDDSDVRPAWQRLLSAIWQEVRGMFVVTRTGSSARATLLPDESYFLYQNLRLQLETARLAVVRNDTLNLRTSMEIIREWLTEYFDTADSAVANVLQATQRMAQLELDPALPDISSSLETLRTYIKDNTTVQKSDPGAVGQ